MEPNLRALILNYHQLSLEEQDYVQNQVLSPGDLLLQQYNQSDPAVKAGFQQFLRQNRPVRGSNHSNRQNITSYDPFSHDLPTSRNKQKSDEGDGDSQPSLLASKDDLNKELDFIEVEIERYHRQVSTCPLIPSPRRGKFEIPDIPKMAAPVPLLGQIGYTGPTGPTLIGQIQRVRSIADVNNSLQINPRSGN